MRRLRVRAAAQQRHRPSATGASPRPLPEEPPMPASLRLLLLASSCTCSSHAATSPTSAAAPYRPDCDRAGVCIPAGAMGDGLTDDGAIVQSAMDALTPGQTLRFPPGTYLVQNLTLPDVAGISLTGAAGPSASVLKLRNGSTWSWVLASANFVENNTFTVRPHAPAISHSTRNRSQSLAAADRVSRSPSPGSPSRAPGTVA